MKKKPLFRPGTQLAKAYEYLVSMRPCWVSTLNLHNVTGSLAVPRMVGDVRRRLPVNEEIGCRPRDSGSRVLIGAVARSGGNRVHEYKLTRHREGWRPEAWLPLSEQNCVNCRHEDARVDAAPCRGCIPGRANHWEPRR